ncbi:hypothetical protein PoB_006550600 [Plakobranchus ocellatus]|uniref:Uncharacterized protein n=1 Tax=Plakobranchus ocellatus TaxID=259542 RepID=A0AAV4D4W8_9GAST|nr:hypothetical protein PoB_006550600 [Plakobranchus ocellatus]
MWLLPGKNNDRAQSLPMPRSGLSQFSIAPLCPPSIKWVAWSLKRSGESEGGEESNGKLPHNAVCQEQSGRYSWFPDAWIKHGTHVTIPSTIDEPSGGSRSRTDSPRKLQ